MTVIVEHRASKCHRVTLITYTIYTDELICIFFESFHVIGRRYPYQFLYIYDEKGNTCASLKGSRGDDFYEVSFEI